MALLLKMKPLSSTSSSLVIFAALLLIQSSSMVHGFSVSTRRISSSTSSLTSFRCTNRLNREQAFKSTSNQVMPSLGMAPGGWGIGTPLDFKDEEFSSSKSSRRRRRRRRKDSSGDGESDGSVDGVIDEVAYNAETAERIEKVFSMENAQQFTQRVQNERNNLQLQKKKDLMEVAKIAGLGDRIKPKVNNDNGSDGGLGKFDLEDDDDDLDVRVQWED